MVNPPSITNLSGELSEKVVMRSKRISLIALLGVYVNTIAYGFQYARGNQEFELALVNWLKNPSLYPNDPITEGFARFPTFFWKAVAYASTWADTQLVLFLAFILTKVLYFCALTRLVARSLQDYRLVACIVCAVALSPVLNTGMPLSDSNVLDSIQTHTSLAIALLLWVGCFLIEGRWFCAALILGFAAYINALFVLYVSFAFAGFALVDWQKHKRDILLASLLLGVIVLPCLALSRGTVPISFPKNYVEMVVTRYPFHYTLRSHSADELLHSLGIILVAALMIPLAAKLRVTRHRRLELLLGFSFLPFLLGAVVGELFLAPFLVLLQFLRSESFLLLYSIILVQIYGGRMLLSAERRSPAATWLLGVSAILWPIDGFALLVLLLTAMLLVLDPQARFEQLCHHIAQSWTARTVAVAVVLAGIIIEASLLGGFSSPGLIATLVAVVSVFSAYGAGLAIGGVGQSKLILVVCALVLMAAAVGRISDASRLWNPVIAPDSSEVAWREVQHWAKASTPQDTKFLTPPVLSGFRGFSERVSWVEWKDGNTFMTFPPYADEWLRRMRVIGIRLKPPLGSPRSMQNDYKEQSWEHLLSVAREEKIDYIVQFKEVPYTVLPVFANERFAVYKVMN